MTPRFLLIEACDFVDFPAGGQLSMARALIGAFGSDLALVGWTRPGQAVGRWTTLPHKTGNLHFFPFDAPSRNVKTPFIPRRISAYLQLRRYRREIMEMGCETAFLMAPETLFATSTWGLRSICFNLSGVNPILSGRYRWSLLFDKVLERAYATTLLKAELLLASADEPAIAEFSRRHQRTLGRRQVLQWPTRVDTSIFHPSDRLAARRILNLPEKAAIFVSSGRISQVKGWRLLLESFANFSTRYLQSTLVFVGDGEDRHALLLQASKLGLSDRVLVTGFQTPERVASFLNAADAVLVGSIYEGWSVAMLEALACGKPIVTTPVSGAYELVSTGKNGFIVHDRIPQDFANAMEAACALPDCTAFSQDIVRRFDITTLRKNLESVWPAIRQG